VTIHDRAIHSQGREMCLALATICECCSQWDGARTLRHAAEYLYREKYRAMSAVLSEQRYRQQIDGMNDTLTALVNGAGKLPLAPIFSEEEK
jgi:hypothetical protein